MASKTTLAIFATAAGVFGYLLGSSQYPAIERSTLRVLTRTDTIVVTRPVAVTVRTLSTDTVYLPLTGSPTDTAAVALPREQTEYAGDGFRAWVSGYRPALDSIAITRRTLAVSPATSRFSFGIQAGIGLTPAGIQPYLGIGLQYRFRL